MPAIPVGELMRVGAVLAEALFALRGWQGQHPTEATPASFLFDEWKECREAIERHERLLSDLRKQGVALIAALIVVNALLNTFLYPSPFGQIAASVGIMILVHAWSRLDVAQAGLLGRAIDRALEIEAELKMDITRRISIGEMPRVGPYKWLVVASALPTLAFGDSSAIPDLTQRGQYAAAVLLLVVFFWVLVHRNNGRATAERRRGQAPVEQQRSGSPAS